ncbi:MAG: hypothetical protein MK042_00575 [Cognatishimia sp.]|nr:hypothetical protein [Cognatishimia sp.]
MSASVIGALRVNLGLDSAKFERGARRVQTPLAAMRKQFQAVAAIAAAAGAAISAAALAGARDIDRAAKSARRLGSSITGFRALELAADEAGVNLSSLANDIQTMNRELATVGVSGNGQRALEKLGLSLSDLAGLDADEKLAAIADRVKDLGLSSGQTTAVLRDLGVRNREMALLMLQGGDAIRRARKDIEDYGLGLSAVDASRIEAANDAIGRLSLAGQYLGQQLALAVVPALGRMATAFTDSLRSGGALRTVIDAVAGNIQRLSTYAATAVSLFAVRYVGAMVAAKVATFSLAGAVRLLRTALIASGIGLVVVAAGELVLWFGRLVTATGGWGGALKALGDLASAVWGGIKTTASALGPALGAVWADIRAGFIGMLEELQRRWYKFVIRITNGFAAAGMDAISSQMAGYAETQGRALDALIEASAAASGKADDLRKKSRELAGEGLGKIATAAKKLATTVKDASAEMREGTGASDALAGALAGVGAGAATTASSVGGLSDDIGTLSQEMQSVKSAAQSAFAGLVTGAKSAKDALRDVLGSFATMLANQAFNSLFGGLFKEGAGLLSGLLSFDGGGFTGNGSRSGGVDGKGGFPAILHPNETVIDHTKGQALGVGSGRVQVDVFVNDDGKIGAIARSEAQNVAVSVVEGGLRQYDQALPDRVQEISNDPRAR